MGNVVFTKEQQAVIDAPIEDILVSAAAGSGKTTVLVRRIVEKILKGEYSLDQILVVTFTRDAASHMKQKIATELRSRIKKESSEGGDRETAKRLRSELAKLPNSYIQTIDSFCTRVINEKSYVCADREELKLVGSGATVLNESELELMMMQAAALAIDGSYGEEVDPHFEQLTHMFGDGRNDNRLAECLVKIYKRLRSMPDYIDLCDKRVALRKEADGNGIVLGLKEVVDRIAEMFAFVDDRTVSAVKEYAEYVTFKSKEKDDIERRQWFCDITDRVYDYTHKITAAHESGEDPKKIWKMIKDDAVIIGSEEDKYNGLPKAKEDDPDEVEEFKLYFGPIAAVLLLLKNILGIGKAPGGYGSVSEQYTLEKGITDILMRTPEEFLELQKARSDMTEAFVGLIKSMDKKYAELKARVHGMDFPDQEHLAKLILAQEEASEYYRNRFKEIYIDEYQDNSALQDAIIDLIARNDDNGNVFRVGDVKQSIYKFRYANPSRFIERADDLRDPGSPGELFTLNRNHRSRGAILDFCNVVFEQLMSNKATEIEYNEEHKLNYDESKAGGDLPRVVLVNNHGVAKSNVTTDGQLHYRNFTPMAVEREIEYYMNKGIEPGKICVLTRSGKMAAQIAFYLDEQVKIPAFYAQELDVFADEDIHGICNILISVANQRRDEYLAGVLLSGYRISNFTLDELASVQLFAAQNENGGGDYSLIDKLRLYVNGFPMDERHPDLYQRVCNFVDWFDDLRSDLVITDIGMLIDRIYRDTGVCAGSVAAAEKFSLFKNWLIGNFMRFGSDISAIASRLEDMKIKLGGSTTVSHDVEFDDRVKCMTIHGSKGLEFDCVIVAELGSTTPGKSDDRFTFDKDMGFVTEDYSEDELSVYTSIESLARSSKERLSDISEDMRLLYVAMTRAKNDLSILVEADLDMGMAEGGGKGKKGSSCGSMIRSILRQPNTAISRQHWLTESGRMIDDFLASLLRLSGADPILQRLNNCFNGGNYAGMVVPIDFEGLECVIYDDLPMPDQIDESDITDNDGDEGSDEGIADPEDEEDVLVVYDRRVFDSELYTEGVDENGMPVFPEYPHEDASRYPFKVSVSQLQEDGIGDLSPLNLKVHSFSHYVDKLNGDVGESSRELGTFAHRLLRFVDLGNCLTEDGFMAEADKLIERGIIKTGDRLKAYGFSSDIVRFASSDLGRRLAAADRAGRAEYEKPIVFEIPLSGSDHALAQGIIDCIFYDEDGDAVILDYKTDTMYGVEDSADARRMEAMERHGIQIDCYAAAAETAGMRVKEKYLVLLRFGEYVKM